MTSFNQDSNKSDNFLAHPDTRNRLFPPCRVSDLAALCSQQALPQDYPLASSISKSIPIYSLPPFDSLSDSQRAALQDEWYRVLLSGPGVLVIKALYPCSLIHRVSSVFRSIMQSQQPTGDHFAPAASNDRIWDALSKHCLADPASFTLYYSNPLLGLVASSWLGPVYRITAQVNNVRPGGAAQSCHRDYHLGFSSPSACVQVPAAAQVASQCLTLQAGVAHGPVPLQSGPTRVLPFSQGYAPGYLAYRQPDFAQFFQDNHVALPLEAGDAIFFNPALFHAAGSNESQKNRLVNLLQIGSAWSKTMEAGDAIPLIDSCWDDMKKLYAERGMLDVTRLMAAVAEGYPFPTNLDQNPPKADGMAPMSEQDVVMDSLKNDETKGQVVHKINSLRQASKALGRVKP
ncbi:hypothetical protein CDD81_729 [Ophiocordyceps australis]|uniref:Phytanoyl-CoA dioxygenase n=1 Tax=Ophiocordyceps australis TaxID=1399860 RepID=A0A2C5Y2Q3_9HYPO|nr:hypothetical protein CDD81_729 [Ophiocordyceps australis]